MRKLTPKFEKPHKPWDRTRIENERGIVNAYGLRRKQEIWKAESILRTFRITARGLEAKKDKAKEEAFLARMRKLGLVSNKAVLDDVLSLEVSNILDRRLQTLVHRKGLAATLRQARQYITHGHIEVGGRKANWPSMIVDAENEKTLAFLGKSKIKPEKIVKAEKAAAKEKAEKAAPSLERKEKAEVLKAEIKAE